MLPHVSVFSSTCRKYIQVKLQGNTAMPVTVAKPALSGQGAEFAFLNPGTQWVSCCFCYASLAPGKYWQGLRLQGVGGSGVGGGGGRHGGDRGGSMGNKPNATRL